MEKQLLDLITEYVNYDRDAATLAQFGQKNARTREQIAHEYGLLLRRFIGQES